MTVLGLSRVGVWLLVASVLTGCDSGSEVEPTPPAATSGRSVGPTSESASPSPTKGSTRDWDADLTRVLEAAGVKGLGVPESAYNSSFLAGAYGSHAVLAVLFDDPVHGLRGKAIETYALSDEVRGVVFEASARSYLEFSCGTDTVQLSVFSSSDPTSQFSAQSTTELARRILHAGAC